MGIWVRCAGALARLARAAPGIDVDMALAGIGRRHGIGGAVGAGGPGARAWADCAADRPAPVARALAPAGPWLALAIVGVVLAPWLRWEAAHDWLPLRSHWFAWWHGFSLRSFGAWLWRVMLGASPFVLAGMLWAGAGGMADGIRSWLRRRGGGLRTDDPFDQKDGRVFLMAFAAPATFWATASALMGYAHLGLVALPGFAGVMVLVARWTESPVSPATHRLAQSATLLVAAVYSILALDSDLARHFGLRWPYGFDPTSDRRGWRETADTVRRAGAELAARDSPAAAFVIGDSPRLASALNFYLPHSTPALACHVIDHLAVDSDFAFWPGYADASFTGRSALFVAETVRPDSLALLQRQFARVESLGSVEIHRGGFVGPAACTFRLSPVSRTRFISGVSHGFCRICCQAASFGRGPRFQRGG